MNKKGMTIVELIVSFALTAVIAFFLTEVVLFLRQAYVGNGIKTELISKQTLISTKINELFNSKRIREATDCGTNCVQITFDDSSIEQFYFNTSTNIVSIGGYVVKLPESAVIGSITIGTSNLTGNGKFDSIFQIYVPITSKLLKDKSFDVNIIYQYNKATENWTFNSSAKSYHIVAPSQTTIVQGSTLNLLNAISFADESNNTIQTDIKVTSIPDFNSNNIGDYEVSYSAFYDGKRYIAKRIVSVYKTDYAYNGSYQSFTAPVNGWYQVELWGAQGGNATYTTSYNGGLGSYTKGKTYLSKGEQIYVYVGGQGQTVTGTTAGTLTANGNGYNGGAPGSFAASNSTHGGGGGSTDIRVSSGAWNDTTSLNSRIMVAGGGGGASSHSATPSYSGTGGSGGTLIGNNAVNANTTCYAYGTGGTQIAGGVSINCPVDGQSYAGSGSFGIGYSVYTSYNSAGNLAGGAGGYYGGGVGYHAGGGGGSSFISGYAGVNAITSSSSLTPTNNTIHYSGKYFIDGKMQAGVNIENGKAKITYISGTTPTRINTSLNTVRYIKDCVNGNTTDTTASWVEIQAILNGSNLAKGKTVTGTVAENTTYPYSRIVDGDITTANYAMASANGAQCVTVDLGSTYNLDEIAIWHYWGDGRTVNSNVTSVSSNNSTWTTVISTSVAETANGKRINAYSN